MITRLSTRKTADRHLVVINGKASNFHVDELVHPFFYKKFGMHSLRFLQRDAIVCLQLFRDTAGEPVFVNNWFHGGAYQGSGLRPSDFTPSAKYSIHKWGGAFDVKIKNKSSHQMKGIVMSNWLNFYRAGLRRIEDPNYTKSKYGELGQDWLHIDVGWSPIASINSPHIITP